VGGAEAGGLRDRPVSRPATERSCMNRDRRDQRVHTSDSDASPPIGKRERTHEHTRVAKTTARRAEDAAPRRAIKTRVAYAHTYKALS